MKNRLKLDFSLETAAERSAFLDSYINSADFPQNPTQHELDVMGDYILWGKDENGALPSNINLTTKWTSNQKESSLDELLESPTFDENQIRPNDAPIYKTVREVFSRSETREKAPAAILSAFEDLWNRIDRTEYLVAAYELLHGRRTTPIRETLTKRFSPDEIDALEASAARISQYTYLKKKRQLVDLRTEQYTLRDSYSQTILSSQTPQHHTSKLSFGSEIQVRPMGLAYDRSLHNRLFTKGKLPLPQNFTESELQIISNIIWRESCEPFFDFTNVDHLYEFFGLYEEFEEQANRPGKIMDTYSEFWNTFQYYRSIADLTDIQDEIVECKVKKWPNQKTADYINEKYGKTYSANYISTLFCKKGLGAIAAAASYHRLICENLMFEENFKKCLDCGQVLLMDPLNFMRRTKSKDGFSPRCKKCEKIKRSKGGANIGLI